MTEDQAPAFVRLADCPVAVARDFGGKASGLIRLFQGGFAVPEGFAVSPEATREELAPILDELGDDHWIVRSSARSEDSHDASFAGLFESLPDLQGADAVWQAIEQCRASSASERVRAYQESRGLPIDDAPIPVCVQRLIKAEVSGVAFTLNPTSGRDDEILLEACKGPGELLVSGRVTPYQWVLDRDGEVRSERPGKPDTESLLSTTDRLTLVQQLLAIQAWFGAPQDIEWVFDGRRFFIVQSRPITSYRERMDMGQWSSADFRDGGVSSAACSPFMYSLYEHAVEHSMSSYFRRIKLLTTARPKWMTYQYGRVYWNLGAVKACLVKVPGYNEQDFDRDLGIERDYGDAGPWETPTTAATLLPAIPIALMLEWEFLAHRLRVARFLRRYPVMEQRIVAQLPLSRDSLEQAGRGLAAAIGELQSPTEQSYFRTIYNSTNLQGEFKKSLDGLAEVVSPAPSYLKLVAGLGEISHFVAERDLHALFTASDDELPGLLGEFLARHGYRGTRELDITVPRWGEDPSFITDLVNRVRASGDLPPHPEKSQAEQRRSFEQELDRVTRDLPWLRNQSFRLRLKQTRDYMVAREAMRDCSTRAYAVVRQFALALGRQLTSHGLLKNPDEVFLLRFQEALRWAARPPIKGDAERLIARRQRDLDGFRRFEAPHEFGVGVSPAPPPADGSALQGIGCSPGRVEAPAFVAADVEQAALAPAGSVLIAPFTDPGWTPVFSRLAGVVTEVGGLLSHAAVLSREYGIPAVLAVNGALKHFESGQRVIIDGDAGTVVASDSATGGS